jgi:glutamyl-tRNA reductase
MVVGEPQILGQLKDSYATATAAGTSGLVLHRCFHKAFRVAKRVRRETAVATKAVSVASAAVELARSIFDPLEGRSAMLVGAGEMSALTARHLLANGVRAPLVTNRTFARAVELAYDCGGTPVPFEQFVHYLPLADLVIGAAGSGERLLSREMVQLALRARKQAPMFLIDLAVPRAFDPAINELDNVYLYDIDDLERVAHDNRDARHKEAQKAELIVAEAVDTWWRWLDTLDVVPVIVALRDKIEGIRQRETKKAEMALRELSPPQRDAVDYLIAAIVNKILHTPVTQLKEQGAVRGDTRFIDTALRLFGLGDADRDEDGEE